MGDPNFHISTARLYLSYFNPSLSTHCSFLLTLHNSPEVQAAVRDYPNRNTITTIEEARANIQQNLIGQSETGLGRYIVSLKPTAPHPSIENYDELPFSERVEGCEKIGYVGMKHHGGCTIPDVGFSFLRKSWGKGYATEAVLAILKYFEEERGQSKVLGLTSPSNEDSRKLFRRIGFEDRGVKPLRLGDGAGEGFKVAVWAKEGTDKDLSVYGL